MAEIIIHLPLLTEDGGYKFGCEIFDSIVKYNFRASFLTFRKWYRDEILAHVVDDMRNAYYRFRDNFMERSAFFLTFFALSRVWNQTFAPCIVLKSHLKYGRAR